MGFDTFQTNLLSIPAQVLTTINVRSPNTPIPPNPSPTKLTTHHHPDDDRNVRLRETQPARLLRHLLPDLDAALRRRPTSKTHLLLEPVVRLCYPDNSALLPDLASDPNRLAEPHFRQHEDAHGLGCVV